MVRVTITQLDSSNPEKLLSQVEELKEYLKHNPTDILLLPEMPFSDWFPSLEEPDEELWHDAEAAHHHWIDRLETFNVPTILGTRPLTLDGENYNSSWIWHNGKWQDLHQKYYLPNEEGFYEANWYSRGSGDLAIATIGELKIGILICTEMWFLDQAREYCKEGIHLLFVPRSTPPSTTNKWIAGGKTAAVISGAFCLSSNHVGPATDGKTTLGGVGWLIEPEGEILAKTSVDRPWITIEIDEVIAEEAKLTYPRYVQD